MAVSPDGKHVVSGSVDHTARIWSVSLGAAGPSSSADNGVEIKGERTLEQRNAELMRDAVDCDPDEPPASRKRRRETKSVADVAGLEELVQGLRDDVQSAALARCIEMDCSSVDVLIEAEHDDSFVSALSLNPNGSVAIVVRKRLAKARGAA